MRVVLVLAAVTLLSACDKKQGGRAALEENPQAAPSVIAIANMFGTCEDIAVCEAECDAGNADRCRKVGTTYQFGTKSVAKDDKRALAYYESACAMKNGAACVSAGQMYEFHHGVDKDDVKAAAFYKQGCDLQSQVGCANYAIMLEKGRGVAKDETAAAILYDKACREGAGLACDRLKVLKTATGDR